MDISRRELHGLWALLMSVDAASAAEGGALPSNTYEFEKLPVRRDEKTQAEFRQCFRGMTHEGCPIDLHVTTMPPGQMPHSAHHHVHEEIMFVQQGKLEATIAGKTTVAGPGSVIYVHSNEVHGMKSVDHVAAQYFVLAIGRHRPYLHYLNRCASRPARREPTR